MRQSICLVVSPSTIYNFAALFNGMQSWVPVKLLWDIAVHLAVAGYIFDGVFCDVLFSTRCLG